LVVCWPTLQPQSAVRLPVWMSPTLRLLSSWARTAASTTLDVVVDVAGAANFPRGVRGFRRVLEEQLQRVLAVLGAWQGPLVDGDGAGTGVEVNARGVRFGAADVDGGVDDLGNVGDVHDGKSPGVFSIPT
jgi:hypothetical protein